MTACLVDFGTVLKDFFLFKIFSSKKIFFMLCSGGGARPQRPPPLDTPLVYMLRALKTYIHIFVKQDAIKPNLTPAYSGLFLVVSRTVKTFRILSYNHVVSVAVNNASDASGLKTQQKFLTSPQFLITLQMAIHHAKY